MKISIAQLFSGNSYQDKSELRCQKLIERVCNSSAIAKDIVEKALDNGVRIEFNDDMDAIGSYSHDENLISLNTFQKDSRLMSTLVHECRHSLQKANNGLYRYDICSAIGIIRGREADAMAHQCAAAYQMRTSEPAAFAAFTDEHPFIMAAYQETMEKSKDKNEALREAFKAWYDDADYVECYDEKTLLRMQGACLSAKAYKTTLGAEELAKTVCMARGEDKPYVEASFFKSQRANTVNQSHYQRACKIERSHLRNLLRFGNRPVSADNFYVRKNNGEIVSPHQKQTSDSRQTILKYLSERKNAGR